MSYDWTTYTPDGQIDTTLNFGSGRLHALLELMRAHDLLDEVTPQPPFPPDDAPPEVWEALTTQESPDPLRIPAFKLRDQNGWKISAAECYLLAHRLRGVWDGYVQELVAFAAQAVAKGGFLVS